MGGDGSGWEVMAVDGSGWEVMAVDLLQFSASYSTHLCVARQRQWTQAAGCSPRAHWTSSSLAPETECV